MIVQIVLLLILGNCCGGRVSAFTVRQTHIAGLKSLQLFHAKPAENTGDKEHRRMGDLTPSERTVLEVMQALLDSKYRFRIVVIGNGAILESTTELGPILKLTQSPSTGKNLATYASKDQSFEFHLQLAQVKKLVFLAKESPTKIIRIIRLLHFSGESMCSLILADESNDAVKWYEGLSERYGGGVQV